MNRDKLADMREVYQLGELTEDQLAKSPLAQFNSWIKAAMDAKLFEVNAMSLATVGKDGQPSCRTVLLKDIVEGSFVFYTNYNSKKGNQILENSKVALLFWWREHERQVRIEGIVQKASADFSNTYFQKRPEGSRIGAIASPQSKVIKDRSEIETLYEASANQFESGKTKCPDFWGGYIVKPNLFEFWQGRPSRLHDRIQYTLEGGEWKTVRLAP